MTKYKLGLVQTNDIISNNIILPLAIGVLWQYAADHSKIKEHWAVDSIVYHKEDMFTSAALLAKCDVVSFSYYVWNFEYQNLLAKEIKKINPNCFIVVGGPTIHSDNADFWKEHSNFIDLAIVGEGEHSFATLLKQWPNVDLAKIPGAWTPDYFSEDAPRIQNLTATPSPYLMGFYDDIMAAEISRGRYIQAILQTNRGCPYHCTFCEEGKDYKNKIFYYNITRIKQEIEWCGKNKVEFLNLADDNFGIAHRDVELMEYICQTKVKYGYPRILDATYAKNSTDRVYSMAKLDKDYNTNLIRGITVALQSGNPTTLTSIKRFNMVPAKLLKFVVDIKTIGMPLYAELIWPLPFETYETFCNGIDQTIKLGLDTWIGVYPLNMQSSAELYNDFKDDYVWANTQNPEDNSINSHIKMNLPMANRWVNSRTVIRGHVYYIWLAVLYFFGFGRVIIENLNQPISKTIDEFIEYTNQSADSPITDINNLLHQYWQNWLTNQEPVNMSIFPDQDTNFWYPYTHVASHLQKNYDVFFEHLKGFLKDKNVDAEKLIELNKKSIVRYQSQPSNQQPEFATLFEFCRYYYWWNRKKGLSYIGYH